MRYRLLFLYFILPCFVLSQNQILSEKNHAIASSTLAKSKVANYEAGNAIDCIFTTAWVEGVKGDGANEWIEVYLGKVENILPLGELDIEIHPGYKKSYNSFQDNGVPSSFLVEVYIGDQKISSQKIEDPGEEFMLGVRNFTLDLSSCALKNGDIKLKITILKVRKGKKYDDTAISEILCNFKNSNPHNIKKDLEKLCTAINKKDKKGIKTFTNIKPETVLDQFTNPFNEEKSPECDENRIRIQSDSKVLLTAKVLGDSEVFAIFEYGSNKWQLTGFMSTPGF